MPKDQLEHISIITEIIAFFFVTIDLYGKKRLEALHDKIKELKIERIRNQRDASKIITKITILFYIFFIFILFYAIVYKRNTIIDKMSKILHIDYISKGSSLSQLIVVIIICIFLIPPVYFSITKFIFYKSRVFVEVLFLKFLALIIRLANLFRIEGIMATIGAVLFVIAKLIAYYAVNKID